MRISTFAVLALWVGMAPGTIRSVYIGPLAKVVSGERTRSTGEWALYGVGVLATVAVTLFATRPARKAMAKQVTPPRPTQAIYEPTSAPANQPLGQP